MSAVETRSLVARLRERSNRPAAPAVVVFVTAVGFLAVRLLLAGHGRVARFVMAERPFVDPARAPRGLPVLAKNGYDGQFFYRLALNPTNLHHRAFGITFDTAFRVQRIGYPVLAWLVSFGHQPWVPAALVIVNLAALTAVGLIGGVFAKEAGRHACCGLLLAGYFGFVFSLGRDTAEPVAAACMLAGLLAYRRRHPALAAICLAYGALTRETVLVAVAAIALVRVVEILRRRVRIGADDLAWVGPFAIFAAWQVVIHGVTGSWALGADTQNNSGQFATAAIHAVTSNVRHLSIHAAAIDAWVVEFAVLAVFIGLAVATLRSTTAPIHERVAFVAFVFELFVLSPGIWNGLADLRSLDEVYLLAVLMLLGSSRRLVVPAWALAAPLVVVFVHRSVSL